MLLTHTHVHVLIVCYCFKNFGNKCFIISTWDEESQHIHVVLTTKSFTLRNKLKKKQGGWIMNEKESRLFLNFTLHLRYILYFSSHVSDVCVMFTYHASHEGKEPSILFCFIVGDFAVLLRAGMTVKQAIIYNCVSSVLGFGGMLIGVLVGNFGSAPLWIFACIGGVFIYIAFVDMVRNYYMSSNADASQTVELKEIRLPRIIVNCMCIYLLKEYT